MKEQVLVIDFEPRSRDATAGLLREQGYDVVTASSLADLSRFTTASGRVPPFVVLEPLLPGTDGFDVCRELKKLRATDGLPPVVLMGGRVLSGPRYRALAHQAGADFFFRRPEENKAALSRLAQWVAKRSAEAVPAGVAVASTSAASPAMAQARAQGGQAGRQAAAPNSGAANPPTAPPDRSAAQPDAGRPPHLKPATAQVAPGENPPPWPIAAQESAGASAPGRQAPGPVRATADDDGEVFHALPSQPLASPDGMGAEDEPLPTQVDLPALTSPPSPSSPSIPEVSAPTPPVLSTPERKAAASDPAGARQAAGSDQQPAKPAASRDQDAPLTTPRAASPPDAAPTGGQAEGAEAVLDEILHKALHGPGPAEAATEATGESADAAIDALFGDAAPPPSKPVPESLEGMDEGTAELLSTLEELEHSVPLADEAPSEPAPVEIEPSGALSDSGFGIETSVPLTPPPPREDEESLSAVISDIATPIAEPVEQELSGQVTGSSTGPRPEKAVTGSQTGPRKPPPESRVVPNAAPSRGVPLVAWLAAGAVLVGGALAFWALRPSAPAVPAAGTEAEQTVQAAESGVAPAIPVPDPSAALTGEANTVTDDSPSSAASGPVANPAARSSAPSEAAGRTPPPATAPAISPAAGGARAQTGGRAPGQTGAPARTTPSAAERTARATRTGRDRESAAVKQPSNGEQAPHPAPRTVAGRKGEPVTGAASPTGPLTDPEIEMPAPPAEPVLDEAPVAIAEPQAPEIETVLPGDGGLELEAAPPPETRPLVPGINGVSEPVLLSSSRVEPDYPRAARGMGVAGKVILRVVVKRDGRVSDIEILSEPGGSYGFGEAAREAVSQWRYRPAVRLGHPVDAYMTVTIQFAKR